MIFDTYIISSMVLILLAILIILSSLFFSIWLGNMMVKGLEQMIRYKK